MCDNENEEMLDLGTLCTSMYHYVILEYNVFATVMNMVPESFLNYPSLFLKRVVLVLQFILWQLQAHTRFSLQMLLVCVRSTATFIQ
jgi:hypothetical protein